MTYKILLRYLERKGRKLLYDGARNCDLKEGGVATKWLDREEVGKRTDPRVTSVREAFSFVRRQSLAILLVSLTVLVPCFWQTKIQAGDLGSHVYNAWLTQLVERGQAPGLSMAHQWNNVIFDIVLVRLGDLFGLGVAEKLAVSAAVLIFVWGAIALIFTVSGHRSWFIAPVVANDTLYILTNDASLVALR